MNMHNAQFTELPGKTGIVLFIHGYMGSPRQFDKLANAVNRAGYSTLSVLLPGHGSTTKAFSRGTLDCWQNYINDEVDKLSANYDHIIIVGSSMGCLLAINSSVWLKEKYTDNARYKDKISALFLISCPLKVSYINIASIKVRLMQLFYSKSNPIKKAYKDGRSVPVSLSLLWRNTKPARELMILISVTKANLRNLRTPVTAVFSKSDEIVSIKSMEMLKTGASSAAVKCVILSKSLHAYYPDDEQLVIEDTLKELTDGWGSWA